MFVCLHVHLRVCMCMRDLFLHVFHSTYPCVLVYKFPNALYTRVFNPTVLSVKHHKTHSLAPTTHKVTHRGSYDSSCRAAMNEAVHAVIEFLSQETLKLYPWLLKWLRCFLRVSALGC